MPIKRYMGNYPQATRDLQRLGLLSRLPTQSQQVFFRDHGVNISYHLKGCTPEKFKNAADIFLEAALDECRRYVPSIYRWCFARFDVRLNRTVKGRKSLPLVQTYTAGKHTDPRIMVYGPGYEVDEKIFLIDQIEKILNIPTRYVGRVNKQRPYTVVKFEVCVRAGEPLA
jgi:hypothetical protein